MAWLTGYGYRKKITITAQSGAGTNYQVKLLIGKTSGATGEQFDLNGHCLDNMNDIRFTGSDETTQWDYWTEFVDASGTSYLATVWVEIRDDLSSSNVDIYCYYGKTGDTDGSSGVNTFGAGKWDDFEWGTDGDHLHTSGGNITWTSNDYSQISTDIAYRGTRSDGLFCSGETRATGSFALTTASGAATYAIRELIYHKSGVNWDDAIIGHGNGTKLIYLYNNGVNLLAADFITDPDTGLDWDVNAWNLLEVYRINWTAGTYYVALQGTTAGPFNMATSASYTNIQGYSSNKNQTAAYAPYIDYVFVRKYQITEPAFASAATEEGATSIKSINVGDVWKPVTAAKINVGDTWKAVTKGQINIGDTWKVTS